ncbi:CBS domain-containing protein [Nonomuraea rhodomycinica]|uniref:CBS domain-containing protein n=1 Tax=Nonomuraea rhodomycinica TaxID=1712872 RepID=A0A7Y6IJN6_9ACTN|nr:CBS domain-containing protein [Nonomuraea rhodomycinica]NUW38935.1 CBS domain-containing protein [Nonomuraea rhodomycinica]
MAKTVADIMTARPAVVEAEQPVSVAAALMRDNDAGAVIVNDNGRVSGIITDRDIAVRVVAADKGPDTRVREACSPSVEAVGPDTSLDQAVQLMRTHAVRRLPVVESGQAVGIVSLGDLAMERDPESALGDISAAAGND